MSWNRLREIARQVHLWIGLTGGIFIFVICLTGTILVFEDDVLHLLNPEVFAVEAGSTSADFDNLQQQISEKSGKSVVGIAFNKDNTGPVQMFVKKEGEKGRPETLYVHPSTGDILGNAKTLRGKEFFMFNFKLHRWFMMETEIGRPIVGFFTLGFVLATITGLIVWFPKKMRYWRQGLKVKWKSNWKRVNHDFHSAFGLYAAVFLLILALTGLCWSFEWYRNGLSELIGAKVFDRSKTEIKTEMIPGETLSLNDLIENQSQGLQEYGFLRLNLSPEANQAMELNAYRTGFAALSLPDRFYLHPQTGAVVGRQMIKELSFGEIVAKSIHDVHMGYIFGGLSKWIFFISSVIATLLPITGILIWWNKRRKKNFKL
ncbi:MAG: PepSY-associated TM helix domain-containing protein [Flavobacteriaceae bacterium]|nr:PepSY-associated TM helix domain-containing protein [Flavobacteriaceae bacterium]